MKSQKTAACPGRCLRRSKKEGEEEDLLLPDPAGIAGKAVVGAVGGQGPFRDIKEGPGAVQQVVSDQDAGRLSARSSIQLLLVRMISFSVLSLLMHGMTTVILMRSIKIQMRLLLRKSLWETCL